MRELAQALKNPAFQSQVRRSMKHVPSFCCDLDLPKSMMLKLDELDRAVAEREAKMA